MAKAHFVKAARKDHPAGGVKKGESYYWWAFMQGGRGGPRHYSKTAPRRSQLTQSAFCSQQYDLEDRISDLDKVDGEDLGAERDSIAEDIRALGKEQQEKLDNMPESLQQGPTGEQLQSRVDGCAEWASDLEAVDCDDLEQRSGESDEDYDGRIDDVRAGLADCQYQGD